MDRCNISTVGSLYAFVQRMHKNEGQENLFYLPIENKNTMLSEITVP